jgi:hypothetical protein
MSRLRAGLVAALNLFLIGAYLYLAQVNGSPVEEQINSLTFSMFPFIGAVLLARHPRNAVGMVVACLGLAVMGASVLFEYGALSSGNGVAGLPLADEAAWLSLILWTTVLPCVILLLVLFPDGRLADRRWRWVIGFTFLVTLPLLVGSAVIGWRNRHTLVLLDTDQAPETGEIGLLFRAYDVWNLILIGVIVVALLGFIARFRRATGIERQQLKWFVYGMSTIPASMLIEILLEGVPSPVVQGFSWAINTLSVAMFPVLMLIAITRYRLYDIDFIIRRTLLYSALTLSLALIYFGSVVIAQALFTRGLGEQPASVLVVTTLLMAALFQPLRRRFQAAIDRRFYRSKYDAEQTLERFAARLQSEVDLDEIGSHLIRLVEENIQPERASLWLVRK